ncbi:MAG: CRISPR-associated endonuclease Cas3'', partial [Boseongicola sp. SB0670_bin_30]|nr:CRISPR-associated endonuclease Cas3'' [Boseongicola sp. SB0670_bin_30]
MTDMHQDPGGAHAGPGTLDGAAAAVEPVAPPGPLRPLRGQRQSPSLTGVRKDRLHRCHVLRMRPPAGIASRRVRVAGSTRRRDCVPRPCPFGWDSPLRRARRRDASRVHWEAGMPAWGKADLETGARHHLAHHCADVAATFIALLEQPTLRTRAERAAERVLSAKEIECLGALAFLHDIGKIAPGFQVKARRPPFPLTPRGHVQCGWKWLQGDPADALGGHACLMVKWPGILNWFKILFAHHGRPVPCPNESWGQDAFGTLYGYDWKVEEGVMGEALISWFPAIRHHCPPSPTPEFAHFVAGLLALADWIGSDREAFPFVEEYDPRYWNRARDMARNQLRKIGIDIGAFTLAGPANWSLLSHHPSPRPAQEAVYDIALTERLALLEAETGSGKTEAALWRFAQLYEAREVDALYFAVPTRAAARQLQRRVNDAIKRMFSAPRPEAVLAIPGQALSGEAQGVRLPEFRVLWDDVEDGDRRPGRWAAEHSTR